MQLNGGNTQPVIRVNTLGESKFTIAMNGKSFRVLSDTLYQDKIGSIVREVSSNALDSHIAAGTPNLPFEIHLPSALEPYFAVRDYGVGLSAEEVERIFTSYFTSTKDQSNDQIGAFGLGSKTPFAYTDSFTVTSRHNGIKRVYSAFQAEDGMPAIACMDQSETTDSNGVEIMVPVNDTSDCRQFADAVSKQLKFFPTKPTIRNGGQFSWPDIDSSVTLRTPTIALLNSTHSYGSKVIIILGPVGYPLDIEKVSPKLSEHNRKFLADLNTIGAYVYFNIGEIEVIASREGISYTPRTVASIDARLTQARAEIVRELNAKIVNLPKAWDQAVFLNRSPELVKLAASAGVTVAGAGLYSGRYAFNLRSATKALSKTTGQDYIGYPVYSYAYQETRRRRGQKSSQVSRSKDMINDIVASDDVCVLVRDTNIKPVARLRHFVSDSEFSTVYVIEPTDRDSLTPWTAAKAAEFSKVLGGVAVGLVSELDEPPRATYARSSYTRPTAYRWTPGSDTGFTKEWERQYEKLSEMEDGGIYVEIAEGRVQDHSTDNLVFQLARLGELDAEIFAIRECDVRKISSDPKWIPATVFARRWHQNHQPNRFAAAIRAHEREYMNHNLDLQNDALAVVEAAYTKGEIDKDNPLAKYLRHREVMRKWITRGSKRYHLSARWQAYVDYSGVAVNLDLKIYKEMVQAVNEAMPYLQYVNYEFRNKNSEYATKHLLAYIKNAGG